MMASQGEEMQIAVGPESENHQGNINDEVTEPIGEQSRAESLPFSLNSRVFQDTEDYESDYSDDWEERITRPHGPHKSSEPNSEPSIDDTERAEFWPANTKLQSKVTTGEYLGGKVPFTAATNPAFYGKPNFAFHLFGFKAGSAEHLSSRVPTAASSGKIVSFGAPGLAHTKSMSEHSSTKMPFSSSLVPSVSFGAPSFGTKPSSRIPLSKDASSAKESGTTTDGMVDKSQWLSAFAGEGSASAFPKCEPTENAAPWMKCSPMAGLKPSDLDLIGNPVAEGMTGISVSGFQLVPPPIPRTNYPFTFHLFPKLPPEMRNMIWDLIVPGKRVVRLYPAKPLLPRARDGVQGQWYADEAYKLDEEHEYYEVYMIRREHMKLCSSQPNPVGLYINKESRSYTEQFFKKIFTTSPCLGRRSIWIRPGLDQLLFSASCFEYNMASAFSQKDRDPIQILDFFANTFVPRYWVARHTELVHAQDYVFHRMQQVVNSTDLFPNLSCINIWKDGLPEIGRPYLVGELPALGWRSTLRLHPPLKPAIAIQEIEQETEPKNLYEYHAEYV